MICPFLLQGFQTYELESKLLKWGYIGKYIYGTTTGDIKRDTRSLDYSSYGSMWRCSFRSKGCNPGS